MVNARKTKARLDATTTVRSGMSATPRAKAPSTPVMTQALLSSVRPMRLPPRLSAGPRASAVRGPPTRRAEEQDIAAQGHVQLRNVGEAGAPARPPRAVGAHHDVAHRGGVEMGPV